jgi:hypothetical protein
VGAKGLGFYQRLNEIDATIDALRSNPSQRLVTVLLGTSVTPSEFARFDEFANRRTNLQLDDGELNAVTVLRAALPEAVPQPKSPEGRRAAELIGKTVAAVRAKNLTIIVGPYAFAEVNEPNATPAGAIRHLLRSRNLPGFAPWLDVMGSIARATERDDEAAADAVHRALGGVADSGCGTLGTYLRLLAANWVRRESTSRLILIACTPDLRLDLALRSSQMPVPHIRLVRRSGTQESLLAERIAVANLRTVVRTPISAATAPLEHADRVVLIKPFGCFENPENVLITAEHWRELSPERQMQLPTGLALEISKSVVLVLGAGALTPSLMIVFRALLKDALENRDGNDNRYLVHNGKASVEDPLHELERTLAAPDDDRRSLFEHWVYKVYGLNLDRLDPLTLLANFDHLLAGSTP